MPGPDTMREFEALLRQIGDGVPDTAQYRRMSDLVLDVPQARTLARLDPVSPAYRRTAMALYLSLRGRPGDDAPGDPADRYHAGRDEAAATPPPADPWTGLVPWSFRDARMLSEHVLAWGHMLSRLDLPAGGSVLEYGPGSGQLLLMLARSGYRAHGVDIDPQALRSIRLQASHLCLTVETDHAAFGEGFGERRFDRILFYESFHHAFEFEPLLRRLHDRLEPGGRVLLCGEPVVAGRQAAVPYPWGPRLDALSVFCIRRFGWMELGFTRDFLIRIARDTGWRIRHHPFPSCSRADIFVLTRATEPPPSGDEGGVAVLLRRMGRPGAWRALCRTPGATLRRALALLFRR